jgi:hypothetical protein
VAQLSKAVHWSGVKSQAMKQPSMTGSPIGPCSIGPASFVLLTEGLAGEISLGHYVLATLCGGPGDFSCPLQHIGAAGIRVKRAVCSEAARLGGTSFGGRMT